MLLSGTTTHHTLLKPQDCLCCFVGSLTTPPIFSSESVPLANITDPYQVLLYTPVLLYFLDAMPSECIDWQKQKGIVAESQFTRRSMCLAWGQNWKCKSWHATNSSWTLGTSFYPPHNFLGFLFLMESHRQTCHNFKWSFYSQTTMFSTNLTLFIPSPLLLVQTDNIARSTMWSSEY